MNLNRLYNVKEIEMEYKNDPSIRSYMFFFFFNKKKYCIDATEEIGKLVMLITMVKKMLMSIRRI